MLYRYFDIICSYIKKFAIIGGMNAAPPHEDHLILNAEIGADGIIYTSVSGRITNDRLYAFVAWAEKVKHLIHEQYDAGVSPVLILSDVSKVEYFERKPIAPLKGLLDYDKRYHLKSAILGADKLTRMLLDAVISFTGRTNIRLFPTKEEAHAWLLHAAAPIAERDKKENIKAVLS